MDIKELRKLINEEVNRRKVLKEQEEKTGAGTPGAMAAQASGQLTPSQQRFKSDEDLILKHIKDSSIGLLQRKDLDPRTRQYIEKIKNAQSADQILDIPEFISVPNSENAEINDLLDKFLSGLHDLRNMHRPGSTSIENPSMRAAINRLPIRGKNRFFSEPGEETAKIDLANAPTKVKSRPSVRQVSPEEETGVFSSLFKESKRRK